MIHYFIEIFFGFLLFIFNASDISSEGGILSLYSKEKFILLVIHFSIILFILLFGYRKKWKIPPFLSSLLESIFNKPIAFSSLIIFISIYWISLLWMRSYEGLISYWYYYEKLLPLLLWLGILLFHTLVFCFQLFYKNKLKRISFQLIKDFFIFLYHKIYNLTIIGILAIIVAMIWGDARIALQREFIYTTSSPFTIFHILFLLVFLILSFSFYSFSIGNSIEIEEKRINYYLFFSLVGMSLFGQLLRFSDQYFKTMNSLLRFFEFKPLIYFLFLFSYGCFIYFLYNVQQKKDQRNIKTKSIYITSILFLVTYLILVVSFKFVISPDNRFWNGAGNPIVWSQISISICFVLLISLIIKKIRNNKNKKTILNILVIVSILFLGIVTWQWQPDYQNYFVQEPLRPNSEYYPYSDAQDFDYGGQFLEYGYGIKNYNGTTNPFTMFLTFIYHQFAGNDFIKVYQIQMIVMLMLPIGIFLIGSSLGSIEFGILSAFLVIFQESNAIQLSGSISNVHIQLLMSEIPTLLLLVWGTYSFIVALKRNQYIDYVLSGLLLGFASLSRMNPLFVVIAYSAILIYLIFKHQIKFNKIVTFLSSFSAIFMGWYLSLYFITGKLFFLDKIRGVINRMTAYNTSMNLLSASISPTKQFLSASFDLVYALINHFLHNLFTTFMVLPQKTTISNPINSSNLNMKFWNANVAWTGEITFLEIIILVINFSIVVYGLSQLWKKSGWKASIPLVLLFAYSASLGAARTSGGRYLTPINWVFVFYYANGIWCLFKKLLSEQVFLPSKNQQMQKKFSPIKLSFALGLISILVVMIGLPIIIPNREVLAQKDIQSEFEKAYLATNRSIEELNILLEENKDILLLDTIVLYPTIDKDYILSARLIDSDYQRIFFPVKNDNTLKMPHNENIFLIGYPKNETEIIVLEYAFLDDNNQWFLFSANQDSVYDLLQE